MSETVIISIDFDSGETLNTKVSQESYELLRQAIRLGDRGPVEFKDADGWAYLLMPEKVSFMITVTEAQQEAWETERAAEKKSVHESFARTMAKVMGQEQPEH